VTARLHRTSKIAAARQRRRTLLALRISGATFVSLSDGVPMDAGKAGRLPSPQPLASLAESRVVDHGDARRAGPVELFSGRRAERP